MNAGSFRRNLSLALPPVALALALIVAWQVIVTQWKIPSLIFPSPLKVLDATRKNSSELGTGWLLTSSAAAAGFATSMIAGTLIALLFSRSRMLRSSLFPYAVFLQTVPIVAIAPLVILWFGHGWKSVVLISAVLGLFPVITNTTAGLTSIDPNLLELFAVHNARPWQIMWKLRLPHAVPYAVAGARVACGLNVVGAIVGEFFLASGFNRAGLGRLLTIAGNNTHTPYQFAVVIASTVLSLTMFAVVSGVGGLVLSRWRSR